MIERTPAKHRLAQEILGLIAISGLLAALLFWLLSTGTSAIVEVYIFDHSIEMNELDWLALDRKIYTLSGLLAIFLFSALFLALMAERVRYIRKLTAGIHALADAQYLPVPLEGSNELTELADAINHMAETRQRLRQREQALNEEKEQLIRTLSHDIRTPLTSILSYSEFLSTGSGDSSEYAELIRKKALQIRDLTDVLLEGSRTPERFDDGRLLMTQLAAEFESELEEDFSVRVDLQGCGSFSGSFDLAQLRRIFDNLSSNVRKYADPAHPVILSVSTEDGLRILQSNRRRKAPEDAESFGLGIRSIRRIAQNYGGQVLVQETEEQFTVTVTLLEF